MQDKIEIGEYIRTKKGDIRQVVKRDVDNHILLDVVFEGDNYLTHIEEKEDIAKHSKYKLELIEEGDYVNGYKVLEIRKYFEVQPYRISIMVYKTKDAEFWKSLEEQDIEDIVTHEQFENVKYVTRKDK